MPNPFFNKKIITVDTIKKDDLSILFKKADEMKNLVKEKGGDDRLKGKIMAALFYEPSSRTMGSFVSAMQRLGGGFIPISGMANTSVSKGETLEDTGKVYSSYVDVIVMRHAEPGSVAQLAKAALVPVINAGDGINEHPTQALLDAYTIKQELGHLDNLRIVFWGDIGHYRPVNSLAKLMTLFPTTTMTFVSPPEVKLQDSVRNYIQRKNINIRETEDIQEVISSADILYVTRVKKEYMDEDLYHKIQGKYILNLSLVKKMKAKSLIMHPLPRVGEIKEEVDSDPRAAYITKQMPNGMYIRMALLDLILKKQ
ncbi:aspartate carbamoyltransferase [Candidatus Gottesmanbacteria bacterium]|nr:aspartate carbamoyltransferase [Candidatus Gottesmanbacteria bacterium]